MLTSVKASIPAVKAIASYDYLKYYTPFFPAIRTRVINGLHKIMWDESGAVTTTPQNNPVAATLVSNTDVDETSDDDVTGAASTLYMVDIDNTANAAITYVKLYDNASPTVGTTAPDFVFKVHASVRRIYAISEGITAANAISMAAVTGAGTAGTTGPTSAVTVFLLTN